MKEKILLTSKDDAYKLLRALDAPGHLVTHVALVGEAAELLIKKCEALNLAIDSEFIRIGVAIHDIGKIIYTKEMFGPGSQHEPEGQRMLLSLGVDESIARCCMSHSRWKTMECSLEELLIALADKLWKGKRVEELELEVIDKVASKLNKERWDIFQDLDSHFELIAFEGDSRLNLSKNS